MVRLRARHPELFSPPSPPEPVRELWLPTEPVGEATPGPPGAFPAPVEEAVPEPVAAAGRLVDGGQDGRGLERALDHAHRRRRLGPRAGAVVVVSWRNEDKLQGLAQRLKSADSREREEALGEVMRVGGDDAFRYISRAFDDDAADVRNAAARALFDLHADRAATFTRALREGTPERRRNIGHALAGSGLAKDAIGNLTGESREKTYDAFSLLFLMAKAGEVLPLMQAIEDYPNVEVRIAVVKLLALSGQPEIIPAFRRMAVRGSLPSEVRSAVMEAIYQIGSQARESAPSAA